jgi:hypothetical protein
LRLCESIILRAEAQRNNEIIAPCLMQAEQKGKIAPENLRGRLLGPFDALCVLSAAAERYFFSRRKAEGFLHPFLQKRPST